MPLIPAETGGSLRVQSQPCYIVSSPEWDPVTKNQNKRILGKIIYLVISSFWRLWIILLNIAQIDDGISFDNYSDEPSGVIYLYGQEDV